MQREVLRPSSVCSRHVGRRLCLIAVAGVASITATVILVSRPGAVAVDFGERVHLAERPRIELGDPIGGSAMSDYRAHVVPRIDHRLLRRLSSESMADDPEVTVLLSDPLVQRIVARFGRAQRRENVGTPARLDLIFDMNRRSELVLGTAQWRAGRGEVALAWMLGVALVRAADDMLGRGAIGQANSAAAWALRATPMLEQLVRRATHEEARHWLKQLELLKLDRFAPKDVAIAFVVGEVQALSRLPRRGLGSDPSEVAHAIVSLSDVARAIQASDGSESHRLCLIHHRTQAVCSMLTEGKARFAQLARTLDTLEASVGARLVHLESDRRTPETPQSF